MASELPSVVFKPSPRLLKDSPLRLSSPGLHASYIQSGSDTVFVKSAIFRATMLVVGLLLLVLLCIACWDSILRCLFCHIFPPAQQQQQLPREMQKARSKVEAVPVERYSSERAQESRERGNITECMICLNEFSEGEVIRILPKCSHYFHMHCVDLWLLCHLSCPICRKTISHILPFPFNRPAPSLQQLAV